MPSRLIGRDLVAFSFLVLSCVPPLVAKEGSAQNSASPGFTMVRFSATGRSGQDVSRFAVTSRAVNARSAPAFDASGVLNPPTVSYASYLGGSDAPPHAPSLRPTPPTVALAC